jgi:phosphoribosylcarboxyaminoimidazole (NCAIR) mutase
MTVSNLSRDELIKALETAEKNPRDRLGFIGEFGTAAGLSAGSAAIASSVLATTATTSVTAPVLGSTFLGGLLGASVSVTSVVAAPVTIVVGTGVAGAVLGYSLIKLIKSGAKSDKEIQDYIKALKEKIKAYDDSVVASTDNNIKISKLAGIYAGLLKADSSLTAESVKTIFTGIENGSIDVDIALNNAKSIFDNLATNIE